MVRKRTRGPSSSRGSEAAAGEPSSQYVEEPRRDGSPQGGEGVADAGSLEPPIEDRPRRSKRVTPKRFSTDFELGSEIQHIRQGEIARRRTRGSSSSRESE